VNFTVSEQKLLEMQRQLKRNPGEQKGRLPTFRIKLADGTEYKSSGTLNFVDAAVDPKSGTVQVRVQVPNTDRFLRAGQLVRVVFPSLQPLNAFLIPQQAVQELQGKRSVYVVDAEGKAQFREIKANIREGNNWVVEGGITEGETVIVEGIQKARPGAPVKAVIKGSNDGAAKPAAGGGDAKKAGDEKDAGATKADGSDTKSNAVTTNPGKDAKAAAPTSGASTGAK
jgi:membrane fusion protein (multidrug efflux system)